MIGLLTWTAHGTWLAGPARGWVDPGRFQRSAVLPEPDGALSASRRGSLKWPAVRLDGMQQRLLVHDLLRIARLREFRPIAAAVDVDHVHVLLDVERSRLGPRLVQLTKGSLSRTLSTAAGDPAARAVSGATLPHHKWWAPQYSLRRVDETDLGAVHRGLLDHESRGATVRTTWN